MEESVFLPFLEREPNLPIRVCLGNDCLLTGKTEQQSGTPYKRPKALIL